MDHSQYKGVSECHFLPKFICRQRWSQTFCPVGRWLIGSFDLISHLTLWLDKDAVILGSTNSGYWPVVDPLPLYGRGRELPGWTT